MTVKSNPKLESNNWLFSWCNLDDAGVRSAVKATDMKLSEIILFWEILICM